MRHRLALTSVIVLAVLGASTGARPAVSSLPATAACNPARVQYTPWPGGDRRLDQIPWIQGKPRSVGLVGLLWYWPKEWRAARVRTARIFTHGVAPAGMSTKVLWAFVAPSVANSGGRQGIVRGTRLDSPGSFRQTFARIYYANQRGAPSFASIVDVPESGCWKLQLSMGGRLRAIVTVLAVASTS